MKIYKKNKLDYFVIPYYRRLGFYVLLTGMISLLISLMILGLTSLTVSLKISEVISQMALILILLLIPIMISFIILLVISLMILHKDIKKHKGYYIKSKPFEKSIRKALIDTMQLNTVKQVNRIEVPDVFVDLSQLKNNRQIVVIIERLSGMDDISKLVPLVSNSFKGKQFGDFAVVDFIENDNKLDFTFVLENVNMNKALVPRTVGDLLSKDLYTLKLQKFLNVQLDKYPSLLVQGATGSGKSTFLQSILLQCFNRRIETHIIDPKSEFKALGGVSDPTEALILLADLVDAMSGREMEIGQLIEQSEEFGANAKSFGLPPVIIVIDELSALVASFDNKDKKEFEKLIRILLQKGRSNGYFCVLAAQNFNAAEVLSVGSRNQPAIRITLGQNSREDYSFIFGSNTETIPDGLVPKFTGFILVRGLHHTPQRFYIPNLIKYKLNTISKIKGDFKK
jgi:hypothetical protein